MSVYMLLAVSLLGGIFFLRAIRTVLGLFLGWR